jgi:hypothetical protein
MTLLMSGLSARELARRALLNAWKRSAWMATRRVPMGLIRRVGARLLWRLLVLWRLLWRLLVLLRLLWRLLWRLLVLLRLLWRLLVLRLCRIGDCCRLARRSEHRLRRSTAHRFLRRHLAGGVGVLWADGYAL